MTDFLQDRVISLPLHTELTGEELKFITSHVLQAVEESVLTEA